MMNGSPKKKILVKATRNPNYKNTNTAKVIEVPAIPGHVAPGDTVEILIPGKEGFTVYLPYGGHFNAQIFEAIKNPEWAVAEMEASDGGADTIGDVWGVRMVRISEIYDSPTGEFPFCVFCKEFKTFAVGQSPPKMHLKP